jgi:hypothetical protein
MQLAKQFVIGLLVIGMLLAPMQVSAAQQAQPPSTQNPTLCNGCGGGGGGGGYSRPYSPPLVGPASPSTFSTSVANGVASSSVTAQNHFNSTSRYTASDFTAMATSLQTFFNEMDATGATASLQTWILANSTLFTTNPSYTVVQSAYLSLNNSGTAVTVSESYFINSITGTPLTLRQQFFTAVQQHGLSYVHSQIVANLNALATIAMNRVHGGNLYRACCGPCSAPWIGIAAAYAGIAALAITGPVGWGIGAVAAFAGVGSLFGLLNGC